MINKKIIIIFGLLVFSLVFVSTQTIFASDETIVYFYSPSCPACIELEKHEEFNAYLEDMKVKKIETSKLTATEREIYQLTKIPAIYHMKEQEIVAVYTGIQDILNSINE